MNLKDKNIDYSVSVLVVLAHFKHNESIHTFLKHLNCLKFPNGVKLEVIICDNSGDFVDVPNLNLNITVYKPGENKYYFGGCWFALTKWKEDNGDFPSWVIVANHDLIFENDFFIKLLSMSINEDVGVIAPDVRIPNGVRQNPHLLRRPSLFSMIIRTIAFRYRLIYGIMNLRYKIKMNLRARANLSVSTEFSALSLSQAPCVPIYSAHGCVFLFRRVFFDRGGSLASKGKMYHEEFLIAERCRRLGLQIIMNASIHVVHNENTVINLVPSDLQYDWMKCLSRIFIDIYRTGEKDIWIS